MTAFGGGRRRAFGHSLEVVAAADIRQGPPGHVGRIVANMHNLLVHHHSSHRSAEEKGIFLGIFVDFGNLMRMDGPKACDATEFLRAKNNGYMAIISPKKLQRRKGQCPKHNNL